MEKIILPDEVFEIVDSDSDDDDDESTEGQLEDRYENVVTMCSEYLCQRIEADNCIETLFFADNHQLKLMVEFCIQYIADHTAKILLTDAFLEVSVEQMNRLLELLRGRAIESDDLRNGVLLWAEYEPDQRYQHLDEALKWVCRIQTRLWRILFYLVVRPHAIPTIVATNCGP